LNVGGLRRIIRPVRGDATRRNPRFGLAAALVLVLATGLVASVSAAGMDASHSPGIVGTYSVITLATSGAVGTYRATFHIDTFNASTGAITGHGNQGSVASFTITGRVKGSTLVMRVTNSALGYTAFDKGTIASNGNISGTLTDTNHNTGTWTMTRLVTASRPPAPRVVAVASGFDQDTTTPGAGSEIDYGVILKNGSTTYDAINLTVTVRAADTSGRSVATDQIPVTLIPAGGTFVVAGLLLPSVSLAVARLQVSVKVGRQSAKRRRLPTVSNVKLDASGGQLLNVTGRISNTYRKAMSQDAPIYVIFLNAQGRIVGGANDSTGAQVRPGATVLFSVQGVVNGANANPVSARVSVDPCSDFDVLDGTCVALARP
jgi:hypothetical protein